jgi:uncharacterized glyoxalase superfamily protein PhnB
MSPPAIPLSVSISDPVSADIQAVCGTITAACNLACTAQGQALIAQALKDGTAFRNLVTEGWGGFVKLLHNGVEIK